MDPGRRARLRGAQPRPARLDLAPPALGRRHARTPRRCSSARSSSLPVIVVFLATAHGMQESMTVDSCGDCHVMESHVADLRMPRATRSRPCTTRTGTSRRTTATRATATTGCSATIARKLVGLRHVVLQRVGHLSQADQDQPPVSERPVPHVPRRRGRISWPSTKRTRWTSSWPGRTPASTATARPTRPTSTKRRRRSRPHDEARPRPFSRSVAPGVSGSRSSSRPSPWSSAPRSSSRRRRTSSRPSCSSARRCCSRRSSCSVGRSSKSCARSASSRE